MIIGIGTDIVQIPRIEKLIDKYGDSFKNKILNDRELLLIEKLSFNKHASFLAKRFAAKESISKAFGKGIHNELSFRNIIVLNNEFGMPYVIIESKNVNKINISLSLSDDYPIALAFAVVSMD